MAGEGCASSVLSDGRSCKSSRLERYMKVREEIVYRLQTPSRSRQARPLMEPRKRRRAMKDKNNGRSGLADNSNDDNIFVKLDGIFEPRDPKVPTRYRRFSNPLARKIENAMLGAGIGWIAGWSFGPSIGYHGSAYTTFGMVAGAFLLVWYFSYLEHREAHPDVRRSNRD
jgi:hypothetical protein